METVTIELTLEERELLVMLLQKAPVTGTVDTLPQFLTKLALLIQKIQKAGTDDNTAD